MARAWSTISSKVIADPPTLWHLCPGSATSVMVGTLGKEHREYTRNKEEWQEKSYRSAGTLTLGRPGAVGTASENKLWYAARSHLNARPPEQLRLTDPTVGTLSPSRHVSRSGS